MIYSIVVLVLRRLNREFLDYITLVLSVQCVTTGQKNGRKLIKPEEDHEDGKQINMIGLAQAALAREGNLNYSFNVLPQIVVNITFLHSSIKLNSSYIRVQKFLNRKVTTLLTKSTL